VNKYIIYVILLCFIVLGTLPLIISLGFQIHYTYSWKFCCYINLANFICLF